MPTIIQFEIPDEIFERYRNLDEIKNEVLVSLVISERQKGHISTGLAAHLLDMSYGEFYDLLIEKGMSISTESQDEREKSYLRFKASMQTESP